jgi:hypothetical protein
MRTCEAIDRLKNGIMRAFKLLIQSLWRLFFPTSELLLDVLSVLGGPEQVLL